MQKNELFIHIGYPKTGSTTLQKHFFPNIDEIQYIGKKYNSLSLHDIDSKIINNIIFKSELSLINKFTEFRKSILDIVTKDKILLSDENFLFDCLRVTKTDFMETLLPHPLDVARKLRRLFNHKNFDVKIIITIRRQDELITSLYAQSYTHFYSKYKETNTFKKFLNCFTQENTINFKYLLDFNLIQKEYEKIFGKNNVFILAFEELQNKPEEFYKNFCEILKINSNKYSNISLSKFENTRSTNKNFKTTRKFSLLNHAANFKQKHFKNLKVKINPKYRNILNKIHFPKSNIDKSIFISETDKILIQRLYENSNRKLSKQFKLGLINYNYFN